MSLAEPAGTRARAKSRRIAPRDMLAKLIAFDTTSAKSNLALIDFVRDYLAGHGINMLLNRIDYTGRIAVKTA